MAGQDGGFLVGRDGGELACYAGEVEHVGVGAVLGGDGGEVDDLHRGQAGGEEHVGLFGAFCLFCAGWDGGVEVGVVVDGVVGEAEGGEAGEAGGEGVGEGPGGDAVGGEVEVVEGGREDGGWGGVGGGDGGDVVAF